MHFASPCFSSALNFSSDNVPPRLSTSVHTRCSAFAISTLHLAPEEIKKRGKHMEKKSEFIAFGF